MKILESSENILSVKPNFSTRTNGQMDTQTLRTQYSFIANLGKRFNSHRNCYKYVKSHYFWYTIFCKTSFFKLLSLCVFNITNIFTELGRLYRYESSSADLCNLRWWRASDLLVWNTADTTRKERHLIIFYVVGLVKTLYSLCVLSYKSIEK